MSTPAPVVHVASPARATAPDPIRLFVMIFVVAMVVTVVIIWLGINGNLGWGIPGTSHGTTGGLHQIAVWFRSGA